MPLFLNVVYLALLFLLAPWFIYKALTTGKYRRGLWRKFTGATCDRQGDATCVWFHGVSVGEVHLLRQLIAAFRRRHPDWQCVVSTTTDTGFDEARRCFPDLEVFYWPFDFSWAVRRALRRVRPSLVVLAESQIWPNFLAAARACPVPVAVVNARMSPRSFARFHRLGPLARRLLAGVDLFAAQTPEYADHLRQLGVPAGRIHVTGSVKYDGTSGDRDNARTEALRRLLAVAPDDLVFIAGSTQAPEEELALGIYLRLRADFPRLRLFLVPRQKDRFGEVASLAQRSGEPCLRRSELTGPSSAHQSAIVVIDTIGELSALWGLADVAFVGGSLDGRRGGQNMIEPAAYGAAVVFGPHVWNFRDAAQRLTAIGGAVQVPDAAALEAEVRRLLGDAPERTRMGATARQFVKDQQGATESTLELLDGLLKQPRTSGKAA